ncbi:Hypothetical_protein [Hexamita inflata]|uniref:Hypothetical_protein n=1 Tax=Hexamita inflata TaxID=28002 RepID=A0AA86NY34_9EUKA|nr:Hypothetical protein HINF_LOCUS14484 [Hexamita inflata]
MKALFDRQKQLITSRSHTPSRKSFIPIMSSMTKSSTMFNRDSIISEVEQTTMFTDVAKNKNTPKNNKSEIGTSQNSNYSNSNSDIELNRDMITGAEFLEFIDKLL